MSLVKHAQSEMRKAGLYSGNDPQNDRLVAMTVATMAAIEQHQPTQEDLVIFFDMIKRLSRNQPLV